MRYVIVLAVGLLFGGCADARITVRDRSNGVALVRAHAVELTATGERELATADARGRLDLRLPAADTAIVAIRAEGFVQWSKSAGWLRQQQPPLQIQLEPVWMAGFLSPPKAVEITTVKPCNCPQQRAK